MLVRRIEHAARRFARQQQLQHGLVRAGGGADEGRHAPVIDGPSNRGPAPKQELGCTHAAAATGPQQCGVAAAVALLRIRVCTQQDLDHRGVAPCRGPEEGRVALIPRSLVWIGAVRQQHASNAGISDSASDRERCEAGAIGR